MASRPLLLALIGVIVVVVASWLLGEVLRQRKATRRRPSRRTGRRT